MYRARGISRLDELSHRLNQLHHSRSLAGLAGAANLVADAVSRGQRIVIVGDFDADGAEEI